MTIIITVCLVFLLGFFVYYFTRNTWFLMVTVNAVLWGSWAFECLFIEHIFYSPVIPVMFSIFGAILYFFGYKFIFGKPDGRSK